MSRTELKVVLCGGAGAGKSGLIVRLVTDKFMSSYDPTIEDSYNKILSVDGDDILLDILDTAGQEQFSAMQEFWWREGEIFLIVYSITSARSFNQIKHFARKIANEKEFTLPDSHGTHRDETKEAKSTLKPFIIVANKCDLNDQRQVTTEQGEELAHLWGVPFFECSCFTEHNLYEVWAETVRLSRRLKVQRNVVPKKHKQQRSTQNDTDTAKTKTICCCITKTDDSDKKTTDNIQFFSVNNAPSDTIQPPVLALKNFRIRRTFNVKRFAIAMLCGLLLPLVILLQSMAFLLYSENRNAWYYPEQYDYDKVHHSILLDYLGLIIGREPGQDPETVKDKKWFLRQNTGQKIMRIILCLLVAFAFAILYYNVSQSDNRNASRQETVGPLFLFWILWFLLSSWMAFEPQITPPLPPLMLTRLRCITLLFGEYFTHRTSAYKFLRAYASAREESNVLSFKQYLTVIVLSAIYALIPGITRQTVGDQNDLIEEKVFWTEENWVIQVGAFLVNFLLVGIFIFAIEVQYSKHFDNYREWMSDLTLLLAKQQLDAYDAAGRRKQTMRKNTQEMMEMIAMEKAHNLTPHKFGRDFSKHLFLSLTRRSNALGWLEIRSFLAIEGKLLFGEQELPTLFLIIATLLLSVFILYRVYFIAGNAIQSILFNGCVVLMVICLLSLIRIAITGYQFQSLQETQERLLGEQKLWMRCNVAENIGLETSNVKEAAFGIHAMYPQTSLSKVERSHGREQKDETIEIQEEEKEEEEVDVEPDNDGYEENEAIPLIKKNEAVIGMDKKNDVLGRIDTTNWYTYNFGFLDDMIFIVNKKDIYPRLFKVKLNSVLAKAIAVFLFSSVATFFKVFV